jgi:formylglycine-generating enzyme required for sulfatase activity
MATTVSVASYAACEGGFEGIFDMVGNIAEWTAGCDSAGFCNLRGGAFYEDTTTSGCNSLTQFTTIVNYFAAGVRCCRDAR